MPAWHHGFSSSLYFYLSSDILHMLPSLNLPRETMCSQTIIHSFIQFVKCRNACLFNRSTNVYIQHGRRTVQRRNALQAVLLQTQKIKKYFQPQPFTVQTLCIE